jgi:hypothetical protein
VFNRQVQSGDFIRAIETFSGDPAAGLFLALGLIMDAAEDADLMAAVRAHDIYNRYPGLDTIGADMTRMAAAANRTGIRIWGEDWRDG